MKHSPLYEAVMSSYPDDQTKMTEGNLSIPQEGTSGAALALRMTIQELQEERFSQARTANPSGILNSVDSFAAAADQYRASESTMSNCPNPYRSAASGERILSMGELLEPEVWDEYRETMDWFRAQRHPRETTSGYRNDFVPGTPEPSDTFEERAVRFFETLCASLEIPPEANQGQPELHTEANDSKDRLEQTFYRFISDTAMKADAHAVRQELRGMETDKLYLQPKQMTQTLQTQFPALSTREARRLVKTHIHLPRLSLPLAVKEIATIFRQEGLEEHKWAFAGMALARVVGGTALGLVSLEMRQALKAKEMLAKPLAAWICLTGLGSISAINVARKLEPKLYIPDKRVNARITSQAVQHGFDGIDPGTVYVRHRDGKQGSADMLRHTSELIALTASMLTSLTVAIDTNPFIGLATVAGLPFLQQLARHRRARRGAHLDELVELDQISSRDLIELLRARKDLEKYDQEILAAEPTTVLNTNDERSHYIRSREEGEIASNQLPTTVLAVAAALAAVVLFGGGSQGEIASSIYGAGLALTSENAALDKLRLITDSLHKRRALIHGTLNPETPPSTVEQRISELTSLDLCLKDVTVIVPAGARAGSDRIILRDVNLILRSGEVIVLNGESGGGKTTLLRLLAGSIQPSTGQILVSVDPATGDGGIERRTIRQNGPESWDSTVAYVTADPVFRPSKTVLENLLPEVPSKEVTDNMRLKVTRLLHDLNLTEFAFALDLPLNEQASEGEKTRLALIRALLKEPRLLLLDEVTSTVDEGKTVPLMLSAIQEYRERHSDVIVISVAQDDKLQNLGPKLGLEVNRILDISTLNRKEEAKKLRRAQKATTNLRTTLFRMARRGIFEAMRPEEGTRLDPG